MDVRDELYGHILGQSASFFGRNAVGQLLSRVSNDVGQVQRAVSETAGDLARETLALIGYAVDSVLPRPAPRAGLPDRRTDPRVSARAPRPARPPHCAAQPGSAGTYVARRRRNLRRPPHRQGVRRRRARDEPLPRRAAAPVSHEHARRARAVGDAARDGAARRHRHGGGVVVRQRRRLRPDG